MRKIRKWTVGFGSAQEKSLYQEFQFINIMAQNAGIENIYRPRYDNTQRHFSKKTV
jgi:hypothetical protein